MSRLVLSLAGLAFVAGAAHADPPRKMNVLFIAVDDLKPALALRRRPARQDAEHRQAGRPRHRVHPGVLPAGGVQPVAVVAADRPPAGHHEGVRPRHALPQGPAGRRHPAAALQEQRLLRPRGRQDLPRRVQRRAVLERAVGGDEGPQLRPGRAEAARRAEGQGEGRRGRTRSKVRGLPFEAPDVADDYLNDGWTANRAIEILESRKGKAEPFFLAVGFLKPHLPFVAPKKYWDLYDPAKLPVAESADPPKDAPRSPRSSAASCAPTTTSRRRAPSRRRPPASWSTATTRRSATWTPRSGGCSTRSRTRASPTTRS